MSDTPTLAAGTGWQYPPGRPVGPGRQHAAAIGFTARPRAGTIGIASVLYSDDPQTLSRCVPWSHGMRPPTWRGLPRGPEGLVGSFRPKDGLSNMPPQPRAIFRKISIASGPNLELTPRCTRFIISVTSASSSLRNRQVAPLMPGTETPRWGRPLPSSIRPRPAKFSGFCLDSGARLDSRMLLPERHKRL